MAEPIWKPWRPEELAARLQSAGRPWCVAGGWALDLWLGRETREHGDLEFSVLSRDVPLFRARLAELSFFAAHDGAVTPLGDSAPPEYVTQLWGQDSAGLWRVDMMIERGGDDETWVYKRDTSLRVARSDMVHVTASGIPFLDPAAVLLFKAKHRRAKDEADFALALPHLSPSQRRRLSGWLDRCHPGHDWLERLRQVFPNA